jgi:hypothetical protein
LKPGMNAWVYIKRSREEVHSAKQQADRQGRPQPGFRSSGRRDERGANLP